MNKRDYKAVIGVLLYIGLIAAIFIAVAVADSVRAASVDAWAAQQRESDSSPATVNEPLAPVPLDSGAVNYIGRTIWGEAGGVASETERAAVAWCVFNRVDATGDTIEGVVTAAYQFHGYRPQGECPQEYLDLAADVYARWLREKEGAKDVGRVLPKEYLYFEGDGERNHFTTAFGGDDYWDWSLPSPYVG